MKHSIYIIKVWWLALTAIFCAASARADVFEDYIARYADLAVAHQEEYGIPASITLAQGLLESSAGRSELATAGNNHFGIKCHRDWTGDTMYRTDDVPDECFRVYGTAEESFADHSRFLCRGRYRPLFELDPSDYGGWARGLSRCGYATDPNYADRLIAIIERYALYAYDTEGGRLAEANAAYIIEKLRTSHAVRRTRGLHYIIATPGDTYGSIAQEFHIDKEKLLAYNDMESDCEVRAWQEVYLQEKREDAPEGLKKVTVGRDESIHSIAQRYGMKLSALRKLNPKAKDRSGQKLKMR